MASRPKKSQVLAGKVNGWIQHASSPGSDRRNAREPARVAEDVRMASAQRMRAIAAALQQRDAVIRN